MLFLPKRWRWLAPLTIAMSWLFPLTFELEWANSLQLTLLLVAPVVLACALATDDRRAAVALQTAE